MRRPTDDVEPLLDGATSVTSSSSSSSTTTTTRGEVASRLPEIVFNDVDGHLQPPTEYDPPSKNDFGRFAPSVAPAAASSEPRRRASSNIPAPPSPMLLPDDGTPPQPLPPANLRRQRSNRRGFEDQVYLGIPEEQPIVRVGSATPLLQRLGVPRRRYAGLSPIRRLFCYVVAFDLIANFIIWVVYLAMLHGSLLANMLRQIVSYSIHSSLFDCIGFALFRFFVLELVYAAIQLRHWWPCLCTMIASTLFMVAKCLVTLQGNMPSSPFFLSSSSDGGTTTPSPDSTEPTFAKYAVILAGIVFSWAEVCMLDFRVLPTESNAWLYADQRDQRHLQGGGGGGLGGGITVVGDGYGVGRGRVGGGVGKTSLESSGSSSNNEDHFHTPVESEEEEDDDAEDTCSRKTPRTPISWTATSEEDEDDDGDSSNAATAAASKSILRGRGRGRGGGGGESSTNRWGSSSGDLGSRRSLYHSATGMRSHFRSPSTISSTSLAPHEVEWLAQARDTMEELIQLFREEEEWKLESGGSGGGGVSLGSDGTGIGVGGDGDEGDLDHGVVTHYSRKHPKFGKIFKCSAELRWSADVATQELFLKDVAELVEWNSQLAEARKIQQLDDVTTVAYSVTPQQGGGIISPRDYVDLQYWRRVGNSFYSCSKGIVHPDVPPVSKFVRGCNGPGGFRISRSSANLSASTFEWIINTSIGGWIPQRIVDVAIAGIQDDFVRDFRNHLVQVQSHNSV